MATKQSLEVDTCFRIFFHHELCKNMQSSLLLSLSPDSAVCQSVIIIRFDCKEKKWVKLLKSLTRKREWETDLILRLKRRREKSANLVISSYIGIVIESRNETSNRHLSILCSERKRKTHHIERWGRDLTASFKTLDLIPFSFHLALLSLVIQEYRVLVPLVAFDFQFKFKTHQENNKNWTKTS